MGGKSRVGRYYTRTTDYCVSVFSYVGGLFKSATRKIQRFMGMLVDSGRKIALPERWSGSVRSLLLGVRAKLPRMSLSPALHWCMSSLSALRVRILGRLRERAPEAVVLLVGVVVSVAGFLTVRYYDEATDRHEFERKAAHHLVVSQKAVDRYVEAVSEMGALIGGYGGQVNRWEFFKFTEEKLPDYPGIQALAWAPRVEESDRTAFEKSAQDDGLYSFRLTERDVEGNVIEAGSRPEYLPLYYVEPYEGNEGILGFDLVSRPAYLSALERARDGGIMSTAIAAPADAANNAKAVLLVISPVYTNANTPPTIEDRRAKLVGYTIGLLDVGAIIDSTLAMFTTPDWLDTYLIDEQGSPGSRLLYYRPSQLRSHHETPTDETGVRNGFFTSADFSLADRNWSIVVKPVPGELVSGSGIAPWGFGVLSLLLTLVLVAHLSSSRNRQLLIERAVVQRTTELMQATESNAVLEKEIAQRKRVERELRAAKDQADVANRAKSDFLAMVSHELRTPLNAVIGFSEVTVYELFGPVGKRYREYGEDIRNSGLHLLSLINNILDLSKVEAKKFELSEEDVDITEIIEEALTLLRDKAQRSGPKFKTEYADPFPVVYGDARTLKQIFINILSNAVKFTPSGGRIVVGARIDKKGRFVATVADNGIGIAKSDQARIFQPFTQADSPLSRKYEGTGLGLPLTKSLVELHDGELKLKSEEGKGTTITIVLPKARVVVRKTAQAAE